jgi:hypothetical protein
MGRGSVLKMRRAAVTDKIIDISKHRTSLAIVESIPAEPIDTHSYIIDLENEIAELREALADKDIEFRRYRALQSKPVRKVVVRKNMKRLKLRDRAHG